MPEEKAWQVGDWNWRGQIPPSSVPSNHPPTPTLHFYISVLLLKSIARCHAHHLPANTRRLSQETPTPIFSVACLPHLGEGPQFYWRCFMENRLAQVGKWDLRTKDGKEWKVKKIPTNMNTEIPSPLIAVFSLHEGHTLANKLWVTSIWTNKEGTIFYMQ